MFREPYHIVFKCKLNVVTIITLFVAIGCGSETSLRSLRTGTSRSSEPRLAQNAEATTEDGSNSSVAPQPQDYRIVIDDFEYPRPAFLIPFDHDNPLIATHTASMSNIVGGQRQATFLAVWDPSVPDEYRYTLTCGQSLMGGGTGYFPDVPIEDGLLQIALAATGATCITTLRYAGLEDQGLDGLDLKAYERSAFEIEMVGNDHEMDLRITVTGHDGEIAQYLGNIDWFTVEPPDKKAIINIPFYEFHGHQTALSEAEEIEIQFIGKHFGHDFEATRITVR